jgi:pimeloyl-ACP methyl ester carboxylesterase
MFHIPEIDLVRLNNLVNDSNPAIMFVIPGVEGNCDAFADLAVLLTSKNIQLYGLEFTNKAPEDSIERAAAYYITVIETEMRSLNRSSFHLAGYSFGGLLAIEICHQLEQKVAQTSTQLVIEHLILFETSHVFFRRSVHAISKTYNVCIPHTSIFNDSKIYPGSLSVYLGFLIGHSNRKFRLGLYDHLQDTRVANLDQALDNSFKYVTDNGFYTFSDATELAKMREYLRHLLVKSNAAFLYEFDTRSKARLRAPVCLIKSKDFLYRSNKELYFMNERNERVRFELDEEDFNLSRIIQDRACLQVFECENGNHWTFIGENLDMIAGIVCDLVGKRVQIAQSKL